MCCNALAEEYHKRGDEESLESALQYHTMELETCRTINNVRSATTALRCLGDCSRDLGDIQSAKRYYQQALYLSRESCRTVDDVKQEHTCSSKSRYWNGCWEVAVKAERSFLSSCQDVPKLMEYYRSLCNLGLTYLNEVRFSESNNVVCERYREGR